MARANPIGIARLVQFLVERGRDKFNGSIELKYRDGQIVTVRREETWVEQEQLPVQDPQAVQIMQSGRAIDLVG